MFFNFQSDRLLNETLSKNVQLLKETDGKAKSFQEALNKYQKEVIRSPRSFGELDTVLLVYLLFNRQVP